MTGLLEALASLPFPLVLLAAWGLAFGESGLGIGMLFPGETGVLILGTTGVSAVRIAALIAVVTVGVTVGDHVGYGLGRRYGVRMRDTRVVARIGVRHWDRAVEALRKYGAAAVFLTRLLPIVRTLTPAAAGSAGVAYFRFLPASLVGGLMWASLYIGAGSAAGASIAYVERVLGQASWVLFGVAVVVLAGVLLWRRRRRARAAEAESEPEDKQEDEPVAG